jgi:hypothetical protein
LINGPQGSRSVWSIDKGTKFKGPNIKGYIKRVGGEFAFFDEGKKTPGQSSVRLFACTKDGENILIKYTGVLYPLDENRIHSIDGPIFEVSRNSLKYNYLNDVQCVAYGSFVRKDETRGIVVHNYYVLKPESQLYSAPKKNNP